jgi:hypothetical protein
MCNRKSNPGSGTSETRWAADPERIDPDDYPPLQPFVRLMIRTYCTACDLQVDALFARYLLQGIACPDCGATLLTRPDDAMTRLAEALQAEDELSSRLDAH